MVAGMVVRSLLTVGNVGILCAVLGCGGGGATKPPTDLAKPQSPQAAGSPTATVETSPSKSDSPETIKITIAQLLEDLKTGQDAVQKKYPGKPVEVKGNLPVISPAFASGLADRDLETPVDQIYLWETFGDTSIGVCCEMSEPEPWQTLRPGQTVRIRGLGRPSATEFKPNASDTYLVLEHAELVEAEPLGTETAATTAEELAQEFLADADACQKKYENQPLIITGKLDKLALTLAAPDEVVIDCETITPAKRLKEKSSGDEVKFLALAVGFDPANKKITLYSVFELN